MAFQKIEFEFSDDDNEKLEIEDSGAVEIDISGKKTKEDFASPVGKKDKPASVVDSDEEDYEVEVVDDTPKADRNRKPSEPPNDVTDEELEEYSDKVRKRIQHFSKGYHDERRAKEEALRERQELERLAQQLVEENKKLKGNVNKNQTALLDQAKKNAAVETEAAKRAYKEAYESGDSDAVLDAQERLTNAKLKSDRLANFKLPALQETETPVQRPVEQTAPAVQVDQRAADWQKANKWFGADDEMTSLALGLHNKLVKQGVSPQSDEYYETINSRMRQVFPDNFEEAEPKRKAQVVAPATRSTAPRKVTLTRTQVQIAKRLGLTPEQYARQVAIDMRKSNG
jgi:hypothetical protein|tara:strand:- start:1429 stop:2454 length:1026 start_codon:yes stop_codon:yes gene_type:complete